MEQNLFFFAIFVVIAVFVAGFYFLRSEIKKRDEKTEPDQSTLLLQNAVNDLRRTLDQKLGESTQLMQKQMQTQFGESRKIITDVTERLVRLDETNKQVVNFADQLKNLQDILKNPKQRGVLGEYYLETVLKNVLPPEAYEMQHRFKDGVIVDAVVFYNKQIIPVDSKFSLENYNRILESREETERKRYESAFVNDLKTRIDETAKYVKPEERTTSFAFMFIPSEAVYYDLLINKIGSDGSTNLIGYAGQKKVVIVSPTSFLAYLQTVIQGMKNQKISEQAQTIIKQVINLEKHLLSYEDYMKKVGKNLGQTVSSYNSAYKEFGKMDKDILKITGESMDIEPLQIEKPQEIEE